MQWEAGAFPSPPFIATIDLDGKKLERIGPGAMATWSPDGQTILYTERNMPNPAEGPRSCRLVLMDTDGQTTGPILPSWACDGAFSRDGKKIAFIRLAEDGNSDVFVCDASGANSSKISRDAPNDVRRQNSRRGRPPAWLDWPSQRHWSASHRDTRGCPARFPPIRTFLIHLAARCRSALNQRARRDAPMRRRPMLAVAVLVSLALIAADKPHRTITGKVVHIADGNTLTALDGNNVEHKIRLHGIDAPERRQPFGTRAKEALASKVLGAVVRVEVNDVDRYHREVGRIYLGDRFINLEMLHDGYARQNVNRGTFQTCQGATLSRFTTNR